MKKETLKKIGKIIGNVVFGIFLVFILFVAIVNLNAKKKQGLPNLFGTGYLTVLTDSMDGDKPDSFKAGDLVVVDVVNDDNRVEKAVNLEVGTIITYYDYDEEKVISHRIVEIESSSPQSAVYVVKGDHPDAVKTTRVASGSILGVYKRHISGLGKVFDWLGHGVGFFLIVVLPCILFLLYEIYRFVKVLIEYNKEKKGETTDEDKIAQRKKVLDDLVKDGVISQEQADEQLASFVASLKPQEPIEQQENEKKPEEDAGDDSSL